jgi:hypothetical protein
MAGETSRVVAAYENYLRARETQKPLPSVVDQGPNAFPWISSVRLSRGDEGPDRDQFMTGDELTITIRYEVPKPPTIVHVGIVVSRNDAVEVFGTGTHVAGVKPPTFSGSVRLRFPDLPLMSGEYAVSAYLLDEHGLHFYHRREREFTFQVVQNVQALGLCHLDHRWDVEVPPDLTDERSISSEATCG